MKVEMAEVEGGEDTAQAAAYVAELAGELASIARRHGLDTLGYILDMAKLEAQNATTAGGGRPPGRRLQRETN